MMLFDSKPEPTRISLQLPDQLVEVRSRKKRRRGSEASKGLRSAYGRNLWAEMLLPREPAYKQCDLGVSKPRWPVIAKAAQSGERGRPSRPGTHTAPRLMPAEGAHGRRLQSPFICMHARHACVHAYLHACMQMYVDIHVCMHIYA
jgi:hypothetical protein